MPNKILGIDLGPETIKIVEFEQSGAKLKPLKWVVGNAPISDLASLLKKNNILTKRALVSFSDPELDYQLVDLPDMPEREIAAAIKYKLSSVLSFPVEDAALSYYPLPGLATPNKSWFFVSILPQKSILSTMTELKKAGLNVLDMCPPALALKSSAAPISQEAFAFVYIGAASSLICVLKQNQVVFARQIEAGINKIIQAIQGEIMAPSGRINIDLARAQELISSAGIPLNPPAYLEQSGIPADEIMSRIRPALEEIEVDIFRTLEYYNEKISAREEFSRIYLSGEGVMLKNLVEYFKSLSFGSQVEILPLVETDASNEFLAAAPSLSLALGAALLTKCPLSLISDKIKAAGKFNFFSVGIIYLIVLGLVWGFYFYRQQQFKPALDAARKELAQQTLQQQKLKENLLLAQIIKKYQARPGAVDPFVAVMNGLQKNTPSDIDLHELSYDRSKNELSIKAVALKSRGYGRISQYIELLKKDGNYKAVDLTYVLESDKFTVPVFDFELKCYL